MADFSVVPHWHGPYQCWTPHGGGGGGRGGKRRKLEAREDTNPEDLVLSQQIVEMLSSAVERVENAGLPKPRQKRFSKRPPEWWSPSPMSAEEKESLSKSLLDRHMAREKRKDQARLPAFKLKDDIVKLVKENQVVVVKGETGCGKTTQVPQYILEDMVEEGKGADCNIVCTQPRRISAISVSERVSWERQEKIGGSVGYQIRMESSRSGDTQLLFCTTGILLRRLVSDTELQGVSHVIVDEIHERDINSDFLLIVLRDLARRRSDIKIVLMSATLNADLFSSYFDDCPMIEIPGFTYPVKDLFLEDILQATNYHIDRKSVRDGPPRWGSAKWRAQRRKEKHTDYDSLFQDLRDFYSRSIYTDRTVQSLANFDEDELDLDLVVTTIEHVHSTCDEGAILCFLSGWDEISKVYDALKASNITGRGQCLLLPLHSAMPTMNQREIFEKPPHGVRKIVIATNIAETSITIDDVVYVVDCGKVKQKNYEEETKCATLLPVWVSKAGARQRRGRAGRCQAGVCYHLFARHHHEDFEDYQVPEMLRTPLEGLALQVKALGFGDVAPFLSKALQPPNESMVTDAISLLRDIGAFTADEELTPLGSNLALLPVDPRLGKGLLYGALMKCLDPVLTITAALGSRDPFVLPIDRKQEADAARKAFDRGAESDHILLLNVYNSWKDAISDRREREFCRRNFLSEQHLGMVQSIRDQFMSLLKESGLIGTHGNKSYGFGDSSDVKRHARNTILVRSVILAGLYPNVVRIDQRGKRPKFVTKMHGKVAPHPSSALDSHSQGFSHRFLTFYEKVKTQKIFIRDGSIITPLSLVLFGGQLNVDEEDEILTVDDWIIFNCYRDHGNLLLRTRKALDAVVAVAFDKGADSLPDICHDFLDALATALTETSSLDRNDWRGDDLRPPLGSSSFQSSAYVPPFARSRDASRNESSRNAPWPVNSGGSRGGGRYGPASGDWGHGGGRPREDLHRRDDRGHRRPDEERSYRTDGRSFRGGGQEYSSHRSRGGRRGRW